MWKRRSACGRLDPDLWFTNSSHGWGLAAHVCRLHCPVLAECSAAVREQVYRGDPPKDQVVAGLRFGQDGRPREPLTKGVRCGECAEPPADREVEAAIAAYARRKGFARCGTAAGFVAHRALGERPCPPCRSAQYRPARTSS